MKTKLSKKQWEEIGKVAGWIKLSEKVSNCCGAGDRMVSLDGPSFSDIGICPQCRDHCIFEDGNEEECNCQICNRVTKMTDTKLCDICWEIKNAIENNRESQSVVYGLYPKLATKIRSIVEKNR